MMILPLTAGEDPLGVNPITASYPIGSNLGYQTIQTVEAFFALNHPLVVISLISTQVEPYLCGYVSSKFNDSHNWDGLDGEIP